MLDSEYSNIIWFISQSNLNNKPESGCNAAKVPRVEKVRKSSTFPDINFEPQLWLSSCAVNDKYLRRMEQGRGREKCKWDRDRWRKEGTITYSKERREKEESITFRPNNSEDIVARDFIKLTCRGQVNDGCG